MYKITIGEECHSINMSNGSNDPICRISMMLSANDIHGIPLDKNFKPAPSGTVFKDTQDTDEYKWYPFPYHFFDLRAVEESGMARRSIYADIITGVITKDNIKDLSNIQDSAKEYITKNFDWYASALVDKIIDEVLENCGDIPEGGKPIIKGFMKSKGLDLYKMSVAEAIEAAKEYLENIEPKKPSTPPKTTPTKTPTAQVIDNLIGGTSQPATRNIPRPTFDQQQAQNVGVVTSNDDGTFNVDYSNIAQQPTPAQTPVVTTVDGNGPQVTPLSTQSPTTVQSPIAQPTIEEPPRGIVVPDPKTAKAKSDVVDNPPYTVVSPATETPLVGITETDSDKLIAKYPQLQLYKNCVGDQFKCEFYVNGKLVSVRVKDKDASDDDTGIESMGATFDVAGAILSPETNKFWIGNDPEVIYDFENPLKLTEEVIRTYLNGEDLTEKMYYSNNTVCELNKLFNVRSVWEFADNEAQATEILQHIKKIFNMPKFKQIKKLTGRRLSMDALTDNTHFVLMTHPGTPDYLGGVKVNKGKTIYRLAINGDDIKLESVKNIA